MLNLNFQNGQAPALNARNMNAIVESINTLGYAVGGPNVASTVSAMTDTSKVYVYTGSETGYTAGNWYYYNGSAWVSGGVYQAAAVETDTTLTMPGVAADAKATGDAVADLKNAINETNELVGEITTTEYSNNRLNPDDITSGCYLGSNGELIPSATWNTTGFCFVENLGTIIGSVDNASGNRTTLSLNFLCTYDNNKNFIEQKYTSGNSTATLDSNVSYVRFSFGDAINPMLSGGTTLPAYVPYSKEVYVITDSTLTEPGIPADALATGNKLDNLGSRINDLEEAFTPTLIEIETAYTPRKLLYSNGSVHDFSSDNWLVSDYVDISAYDEIKIIATSGWTNSYYAFYDANNTFVSGKQASSSIVTTVEDIIQIASNIKYVRIQKFLDENTGESSDGIFRPGLSPLTQPKKWEGKKWVCLGDSLTEVNSRTTKHYHDYISEATGITVVNMGDSGSGYMNEQNLGTAFYQRAANVPTDADVYTIFGSGNDLSHTLGDPTDTGTTTICGCINQTIDVLIGRIPTIQLGIVAPTPWEPYQPDLNNTNLMAKYVQALKDICYIRSIPFLDLYHESNLRPWTAEGRAACYSKDNGGGTHPDEAGHKIIAPRFEGFLDTLLLD